jgi:hypothetical protein
MPDGKRYVFTFSFAFDRKVEDKFLSDICPINEAKLRKLGYDAECLTPGGKTMILASIESGRLLNLDELAKLLQAELLHFKLDSVVATLRNTLLPSPDEKQEKLGEFKYRDGQWEEIYNGVTYHLQANRESKVLLVTVHHKSYKDGEEWARDFSYLLKSIHHSAFLASRVRELSYAMKGDDEAHMVAAQGKLMAAIAFRIV